MVSTEHRGTVDKELERKVHRSEPLLVKAWILGRACEARVKEGVARNKGSNAYSEQAGKHQCLSAPCSQQALGEGVCRSHV